MTRKTAIVVCPGRGTYNAAELGYLSRHHSDKPDFIAMIESIRRDAGQETISTLDGADRFSPSKHGRGDNASLLIYACAMADFQSINRDLYDIIGVTGNSMGWYLSLAAGGALSFKDAGRLVNTMGGIMTDHGRGGQVVFSLMDDRWNVDNEKAQAVMDVLQNKPDRVFLDLSIHLGGMAVLAGDKAGLEYAMQTLPKDDRFPFQIRGHSAFHSSLLDHTIPLAQKALGTDMFGQPDIPMIDGLGHIWPPYITDTDALYDYTLGRQINGTYDFSKAIEVAAKEFAPDVFIVLGPGTTMGAPVAQTLISLEWYGMATKSDFQNRQKTDPVVLSMGMENQRNHVTAN